MKILNFKITTLASLACIIGMMMSLASPGFSKITSDVVIKDTIRFRIVKVINGKKAKIDTSIIVEEGFNIENLMQKNFSGQLSDTNFHFCQDSAMSNLYFSCGRLEDSCHSDSDIMKYLKEEWDSDSILGSMDQIYNELIQDSCILKMMKKRINRSSANEKNEATDSLYKIQISSTIIKNCNSERKTNKPVACKVIVKDMRGKERPPSKINPNPNETLKMNYLDIFPNPGKDKITVSFSLPGKESPEIIICDSYGKEIIKESLADFNSQFEKEYGLEAQPKGTYFVIIRQGAKSVTKKVILQ